MEIKELGKRIDQFILRINNVMRTGVDFPMPLSIKIGEPIEKPDSETPKFQIK